MIESMSAKILKLPCLPNLVAIMTEAIEQYVAIQYPPDSADCALAAREALLDVVTKINQTCTSDSHVLLSRRLRTLLKIAINYYCDQWPEAENLEVIREQLLQALYEKEVDDALLAALHPDLFHPN
jgi:hypothetical protein